MKGNREKKGNTNTVKDKLDIKRREGWNPRPSQKASLRTEGGPGTSCTISLRGRPFHKKKKKNLHCLTSGQRRIGGDLESVGKGEKYL